MQGVREKVHVEDTHTLNLSYAVAINVRGPDRHMQSGHHDDKFIIHLMEALWGSVDHFDGNA